MDTMDKVAERAAEQAFNTFLNVTTNANLYDAAQIEAIDLALKALQTKVAAKKRAYRAAVKQRGW